MITDEAQAKRAAEEFLDISVRPSLDQDVVITSVREFPTCWIFGYNTRAFAENGEISNALAGNGPIIVNRKTGTLRMGTSSLPAEDQVDPE